MAATATAPLRISILLPLLPPANPSGGFRVHLEYANRLAALGHHVTVVFPATIPLPGPDGPSAPPAPSPTVAERLWWFDVDRRVHVVVVPDLRAGSVPPSDVVVLTSWATAEAALDYPPSTGRKVYVVYDYEYWRSVPDDVRQRMRRTYQLDAAVVATSVAVEQMLAENGVRPAATIPCGLDLTTFRLYHAPETRKRWRVGLPLRRESFKGTADGVAAMVELRRAAGPALEVVAFGSADVPGLPSWVEVVPRPSDAELCELYNSVSVFVLPSLYEGWGLPGCEAMACGAALVTTDSVGVRSYATHGDTAVVVPPGRPDLIAAAVAELWEDDAERQRIARAGHAFVQRFNWDASVTALDRLMAGIA